MAVLGKLSIARFSFQNQVIVFCTRPGTKHVATFQRWKAFGRSVKKGEKAIGILRPVFRPIPETETEEEREARLARPVSFGVLPTFALDQTSGDDLPEVKHPDFTAEEAFGQSVETLRQVAERLPGAPVAAIAIRERQPGDHPTARGWYRRSTREIAVMSDQDRVHRFSTESTKSLTPSCMAPATTTTSRPRRSRQSQRPMSSATPSGWTWAAPRSLTWAPGPATGTRPSRRSPTAGNGLPGPQRRSSTPWFPRSSRTKASSLQLHERRPKGERSTSAAPLSCPTSEFAGPLRGHHVVVLNKRHLNRLLRQYVAYYHEDRTHLGLGKATPSARVAQQRPDGAAQLVALPRIGGLHHRYEWRAAA
jgi:hypothetical protein